MLAIAWTFWNTLDNTCVSNDAPASDLYGQLHTFEAPTQFLNSDPFEISVLRYAGIDTDPGVAKFRVVTSGTNFSLRVTTADSTMVFSKDAPPSRTALVANNIKVAMTPEFIYVVAPNAVNQPVCPQLPSSLEYAHGCVEYVGVAQPANTELPYRVKKERCPIFTTAKLMVFIGVFSAVIIVTCMISFILYDCVSGGKPEASSPAPPLYTEVSETQTPDRRISFPYEYLRQRTLEDDQTLENSPAIESSDEPPPPPSSPLQPIPLEHDSALDNSHRPRRSSVCLSTSM